VLCALAFPVTITPDMKSNTNRIHTDLIQNVFRPTVLLSETNAHIQPGSYASDYLRALKFL
jgi:hypothetical protein